MVDCRWHSRTSENPDPGCVETKYKHVNRVGNKKSKYAQTWITLEQKRYFDSLDKTKRDFKGGLCKNLSKEDEDYIASARGKKQRRTRRFWACYRSNMASKVRTRMTMQAALAPRSAARRKKGKVKRRTRRCKARTKKGHRCKRRAKRGRKTCCHHRR